MRSRSVRHLLRRLEVRLGQRHQVLPGGGLQAGHPVALGGDELFKEVPHLAAVGEVGGTGLVQVAEKLRQEALQLLVRLVLVLLAQPLKDGLELGAGVVIEVEVFVEPGF